MNRRNDFRMMLQRFFYGRNGRDILSRDVYILSIILLFINIFARVGILGYLALIGFIYAIFRMFSRNIAKRQAENMKYLAWRNKVTGVLNLGKRQWQDRDSYRYYICKKCGQKVRVPKGRGKIEIRCPRCGETFIKKT